MKRLTACIAMLLLLPGAVLAAHAVDINSANERTLANALEGVGQEGAKAIVDYRREHGTFKSVEQLALVKGIGLRAVERNRERIVLGNGRNRDVSSQQEGKAEGRRSNVLQ